MQKIYDFGTGNTNPETFPADELVKASERAIRNSVDLLNRYPGEFGHLGLRQLMAQRESEREGIAVDPERIALFNGSMQAVSCVAQGFMKRNEPNICITEEFTYNGTIGAFRRLGLEMAGVAVDQDGMRMDSLREVLARLKNQGRKPIFIYTEATYQNPCGSVMPTARRREMIHIAKEQDLVIFEDNCYGDVHYEGDKPPAFFALDPSPNQIYACSLSKIFAPGVRLGYIYAQPPHLQRILTWRMDAGSNTFAAAVSAEYLRGRLWEHCDYNNAALKKKRDALFGALEKSLGNLCTWSHPVGGLFLWMKLPNGIDMARLAKLADERGVKYVAGQSYHVEGREVPYLRLAFGYPPIADIEAGIPILASCISDASS